jgi:hypothetical protein
MEMKEMLAVQILQSSLTQSALNATQGSGSVPSLLAHSTMQATTTPQPAITKSGYLEVRPEKKSNWKQRWVQIDDGQLRYFKNYKVFRVFAAVLLLYLPLCFFFFFFFFWFI